jgi:hypothetical protein
MNTYQVITHVAGDPTEILGVGMTVDAGFLRIWDEQHDDPVAIFAPGHWKAVKRTDARIESSVGGCA